MGTLPQLIEEDIHVLNHELKDLLLKSEASSAMVIDKAGFLITSSGTADDMVSIAALASGAYMATQTIANMIQEPSFNSVYHQGQKFSLLVMSIDEQCLLTVVFPAEVSVGAVKYFGHIAAGSIATQLVNARARNPSDSMDLSIINMADTTNLFKKKE
jgi:predicted regulator of Ras-like GTPase activity (Roadblock/LC7/MglB family)